MKWKCLLPTQPCLFFLRNLLPAIRMRWKLSASLVSCLYRRCRRRRTAGQWTTPSHIQLQSHQVPARSISSAQLSGQTRRAGYVDQLITVLRLSRSILPAAVNTYANKPFDDSICLCLEDNDAGLTCICSFRVSRQLDKTLNTFMIRWFNLTLSRR